MRALDGQAVLATGANRGMSREYVARLLDRGGPDDVIRQVLDGIESGADEVLADEMTRLVRAELSKPIA